MRTIYLGELIIHRVHCTNLPKNLEAPPLHHLATQPSSSQLLLFGAFGEPLGQRRRESEFPTNLPHEYDTSRKKVAIHH